MERPYQRPVPGPREVRTPHHPGVGGSGGRGSASAHTRKGHAGTTRGATGPSSRNAQTAWNGVPASEGKGHPDETTRHTQRGTRGAGRGKRERHNTRYRPKPSEPAASAAHTRTGQCTRQGSSGALGFTRIGEEEGGDGEAIALHKTHIWANSLKPVCFLCFLLFWCRLLPFIETGTLKIYTKMVLYMKNEIFDLKYPLHGV